jgi:hypothetical protein
MKEFTIKRVLQTSDGTFGVLAYSGTPFGNTLELPWNENKKNVSCIPAGRYKARYIKSPKHGWCYELQAVPGRGNIQIHVGNTKKDLLGCIAPGKQVGKVWLLPLKSVWGVTQSRVAYNEFISLACKDVEIMVNIEDAYGYNKEVA